MDEVLRLLLGGEVISGAQISERLGITRAAVWKRVEQLRAAGYDVQAVGRRGYRLAACPDALDAPLIERGLRTVWAGRPTLFERQVDSTNLWARRMARWSWRTSRPPVVAGADACGLRRRTRASS